MITIKRPHLGIEAAGTGSEAFVERIKNDVVKWCDVAHNAKIVAQ